PVRRGRVMIPTFDDDTLLDVLGEILAPEPVEPGPEALAALHRALATRSDAPGYAVDRDDLAAVLPFAPPAVPATRRSATWAGLHRLRHPVAAAVAVGVLATSGVAAAGVATDHLPGPTRSVAFALGLPVTSPSLEAARGTMGQLRVALAARDVAQVRASATLLRSQVDGLAPADRAQIEASAGVLLTQAYAFLIADSGSGSTPGSSQTPSGGTGQGSSDSSGSSRSGTSGGSGSSDGGGTNSSDGGSTPGTGGSSSDSTPGTSGSSDGNSGGSGSTGTTDGPPQSTPGSTTPPRTTQPGDDATDGGTDDRNSKSNSATTQPGHSTGTAFG
ncbi:MAG TPA: hypothetical protein VF320_07580, partial [Acidimicrobiales bacterium]